MSTSLEAASKYMGSSLGSSSCSSPGLGAVWAGKRCILSAFVVSTFRQRSGNWVERLAESGLLGLAAVYKSTEG
jgi:hypothetical protein